MRKLLLTSLGLLCMTVLRGESSRSAADESTGIGTTTQTFRISYQSVFEKNVRIYKARNEAGQPKNKVLWRDGNEILLKWTLPRCPNQNDPCDWDGKGTIPSFKIAKRATKFGYGINGDQFVDMPDAICSADDQNNADPQPEKEDRELKSGLEGTAVDKEERQYKIDIEVISRVKKENNGIKLEYSFKIENRNATKLMISDNLASVEGPAVVWAPVNFEQFHRALDNRKNLVNDPRAAVVVSLPAESYVIRKGPLRIMVRGEVLAEVTAPAYVPKNAVYLKKK